MGKYTMGKVTFQVNALEKLYIFKKISLLYLSLKSVLLKMFLGKFRKSYCGKFYFIGGITQQLSALVYLQMFV